MSRPSWARQPTMADFRIRAGFWCCRWCKAKAKAIAEIVHRADSCRLVNPVLAAEHENLLERHGLR